MRLTGEAASRAEAAAVQAEAPLATWTRALIEREVGIIPGTENSPAHRLEPMKPDELSRRTLVRRLGEVVDILRGCSSPPEDVLAELRQATAAAVATLPRRPRS